MNELLTNYTTLNMVIDVITEWSRYGLVGFLDSGEEFSGKIFAMCLEFFFTFLH